MLCRNCKKCQIKLLNIFGDYTHFCSKYKIYLKDLTVKPVECEEV
jgi:hypothetical protein